MDIYLKTLTQISVVLFMCIALMIQPVVIDWFWFATITLPMNWIMFTLLAVFLGIVSLEGE